ncbi:alpha/beta hydrolase [Streptodolium elevatio]|uniref:Alpha/beta hydrolase n=1 Tax=Streptodolium elevatio TaxID=3157996 RepID=A0ABV3DCT5_9ACTN
MGITTGSVSTKDRLAPRLTYEEQRTESKTLAIFLHGLGLDARDYRGYLDRGDGHGVALTLPGFEPDGVQSIPPVELATHVELASSLVRRIAVENPGKRLALVGFSLGADMILRLAEHWWDNPAELPEIHSAVLLDPNVNQSTMTISRLFADADPEDPVPAFTRLVSSAADPGSLSAICQYVAKIAKKDFAQLRQMSRDMIDYWDPAGYEQFGRRLAAVSGVAGQVRVVLSAPYVEHLDAMRATAAEHGARSTEFELTGLDHFGLVNADVLAEQLEHLETQSS